jgi:hypothetical protein
MFGSWRCMVSLLSSTDRLAGSQTDPEWPGRFARRGSPPSPEEHGTSCVQPADRSSAAGWQTQLHRPTGCVDHSTAARMPVEPPVRRAVDACRNSAAESLVGTESTTQTHTVPSAAGRVGSHSSHYRPEPRPVDAHGTKQAPGCAPPP